MTRRMVLLLCAALFSAVAHCGGGGPSAPQTFSCTLSAPALENTTTCMEYGNGWTQSQAQMLCGNAMATASAAACVRTNVIGGCRTTETLGLAPSGSTTTMWFTPVAGQTVTAAQVMAQCSMMSGYTYVAP